jgi:hypothetical protein
MANRPVKLDCGGLAAKRIDLSIKNVSLIEDQQKPKKLNKSKYNDYFPYVQAPGTLRGR